MNTFTHSVTSEFTYRSIHLVIQSEIAIYGEFCLNHFKYGGSRTPTATFFFVLAPATDGGKRDKQWRREHGSDCAARGSGGRL